MAKSEVAITARGRPTIPAMDYEVSFLKTNSQQVLGNSNPTTLHVVTFTDAGTTWEVEIWQVFRSGTSSGVSIKNAVQGTFGFNAHAQAGWIINGKTGTPGQAVIAFRER